MKSISREILEAGNVPPIKSRQAKTPSIPVSKEKLKTPEDLIADLSPESDADILMEITDLAVLSTQEDAINTGEQFDLIESTISACCGHATLTSLYFESWYGNTYWFPFSNEELATKISEIISKHKLPLSDDRHESKSFNKEKTFVLVNKSGNGYEAKCRAASFEKAREIFAKSGKMKKYHSIYDVCQADDIV